MPIHRADGSIVVTEPAAPAPVPGVVVITQVLPVVGIPGPPGPPGPGGATDLPEATDPNAVIQRPVVGDAFAAPLTLDQILPAYLITLSGGGDFEVGEAVINPAFTATYNRPPTTASINLNSVVASVIGTPTSFSSITTVQRFNSGEQHIATLTSSEGGPNKMATALFRWFPRIFYGVGAPGQSGEAFLEALASSYLAGVRTGSFTATAGVGEKLYFGYPVAFGLATFFIGGFEGGYLSPTTILGVTNPYGVVLDYYLYESATPNLGLTTTVVT